MDTATTVIAIFAVLIVAVVLVFRQRIAAKIKGPGNINLEIDASNPSPRPGVRVKGATSRKGGLTVMDKTGRGSDVEDVDADKDINVSSSLPGEGFQLKKRPPA